MSPGRLSCESASRKVPRAEAGASIQDEMIPSKLDLTPGGGGGIDPRRDDPSKLDPPSRTWTATH